MNQIKIAQTPVYTSPNPMTFICSKKADGKRHMPQPTPERLYSR